MIELKPNTTRQAANWVLIVPHCFEYGESLRLLLTLGGYHAEVVRDGEDAIGRAMEELPQAVLIDVNRPDDGSRELFRRFRAALGSCVRLIGLFPWLREEDVARWETVGLDGWLRKPVEPDRLFGLLAGARQARPGAPDRPRE